MKVRNREREIKIERWKQFQLGYIRYPTHSRQQRNFKALVKNTRFPFVELSAGTSLAAAAGESLAWTTRPVPLGEARGTSGRPAAGALLFDHPPISSARRFVHE
ncbi:hypothetical protein EVAR_11974_1 [Eumeta japonica]|uniref:Uncharacterized protein n=1 Tax=Eumeta variegata TaxID=151549 RepID=A0A4C1U4Q2_EUMVA|nr:hypothetical protein EVAR_11974_1 [Eumeta japonica]